MSRYKNSRKAYTYFNQIALIEREIKIKREQIKGFRDISSNSGSERVQSSKSPDKIGDCVSMIEEIEEKIEKDIKRLVESKDKALDIIEKIKELDIKQVIWYRYLKMYDFHRIAKEMKLSESTIYRLHNKGIKKINEILQIDS